jgi:HD-GYP domain-containing protein (c-di-GMP phosphodiesterase class II)
MVLEREPRPVVTVADRELAGVAATFADLADLKSPCTHGHSRGVATLAREAGERLRLPPGGVTDLEVAGLLHDVGLGGRL